TSFTIIGTITTIVGLILGGMDLPRLKTLTEKLSTSMITDGKNTALDYSSCRWLHDLRFRQGQENPADLPTQTGMVHYISA
ncbi:MAG: hypothetical protein HOC23_06800, partial [Halieaceae bacterium]|nr:hypothetical protein [Halieaceae bacterium]